MKSNSIRWFVLVLILVFIQVWFTTGCSVVRSIQKTPPKTTKSTVITTGPGKTTTPAGTTTPSIPTPSGDNLTIHFIDVGQGDAILIDQGETEVLIDAGASTPGVSDYLAKYVDGPLEVMVATHVHADHIGGLTEVLNKYEVKDIWDSGDTTTTVTYKNFMAAVKVEGAGIHEALRGQTITTGVLTFQILNPGQSRLPKANNTSVVLWLKYGDTNFLFEGDAETEAEAEMLSSPLMTVPDCDILKVGHHGSRTASSVAYLAAAKPEVAIYMAGTGNTYGHPHPETITALKNIGADIYGTDISGTIVVTTNGSGYRITTAK
jgi:competence protein ComEC